MAKKPTEKKRAKKPAPVAKVVKQRKSLLLDRALLRESKEAKDSLKKHTTLGGADRDDADYAGSDAVADQIADMSPEDLVNRLDKALIGRTLSREQRAAAAPAKVEEVLDETDMRAVDVPVNFRVRKKLRAKFSRRLQRAQDAIRDHLIFKIIPVALAFENAAEDAQTALRELGHQPDATLNVGIPRVVLRTMMNESLVTVMCDQLKIPREHGISLLGELRNRNKEQPNGKGISQGEASPQRPTGGQAVQRRKSGLGHPSDITAGSIRSSRTRSS